ncbi:MAG: hypothetical protein ACOZJX_19135 [Pseudomonadota bacterium]
MADCANTDLIMFWTRATVLVITALAGVMCIYLGWRLYIESVRSSTQGEFEGMGFKFKLVSFGPGVFLAALGVWLLAGVANRPIQLEDREGPPQPIGYVLPSKEGNFSVQASQPQQSPPCLVKQRKRVWAIGRGDLTALEIAHLSNFAADAIAKAKGAGIEDAEKRADIISRLRLLSDMAENSVD